MNGIASERARDTNKKSKTGRLPVACIFSSAISNFVCFCVSHSVSFVCAVCLRQPLLRLNSGKLKLFIGTNNERLINMTLTIGMHRDLYIHNHFSMDFFYSRISIISAPLVWSQFTFAPIA